MKKKIGIKNLKKIASSKKEIVFAFLFGSAKNGVLVENADVDLAIYIEKTLLQNINLVKNLLCELVGECQLLIKHEKIDITILNYASPILAFEALSGKILVCKNQQLYQDFYSYICRRYEDDMYKINRALRNEDQ